MLNVNSVRMKQIVDKSDTGYLRYNARLCEQVSWSFCRTILHRGRRSTYRTQRAYAPCMDSLSRIRKLPSLAALESRSSALDRVMLLWYQGWWPGILLLSVKCSGVTQRFSKSVTSDPNSTQFFILAHVLTKHQSITHLLISYQWNRSPLLPQLCNFLIWEEEGPNVLPVWRQIHSTITKNYKTITLSSLLSD